VKRLRLAAVASVLWFAVGCVSKNAGYDLTRQELASRAGVELPEDVDGTHDDKVVQGLLAKPLTADSAARIALWNNADVQAALDDVGVARGAVVAALALPNPRAGFGASFFGDGEPDVDLDLTIDITHLFLMPAREAAASATLEATALEAAGAALDIAFEARTAFYVHEAASEKLELEKTILYAAAQSADIAKRLEEAGNVPALEELTERALYEESRVAVAEAETELTVARERLNAAMGLFGERGAKWKSAGKLPDPTAFDDAKLETRAVEKNLDLRALEKRYEAASGRSDLAWAEGLVPEVAAGVGAERDDGEWGVGPRVEVDIPLFYQGQGAADAAEAEARAARHRHEAIATRVRATARAVRARLRATGERATFYRTTLLPLREKIVDETLLQYNAMNTGPLQLLAAKRDQIETATAYVDTLRDHFTARAEAEALLAGRLPGMSVRFTQRRGAVPSTSDGH
jgi:outer membrane protein, heavy metal efflux system